MSPSLTGGGPRSLTYHRPHMGLPGGAIWVLLPAPRRGRRDVPWVPPTKEQPGAAVAAFF